MWGHHVHEAVVAAGRPESGCTVHFVNNEYDSGPIILQRKCPVLPDDTPDSLAARVFEQECIAYPEAIRLYANRSLFVKDGRVQIDSRLSENKKIKIKQFYTSLHNVAWGDIL